MEIQLIITKLYTIFKTNCRKTHLSHRTRTWKLLSAEISIRKEKETKKRIRSITKGRTECTRNKSSNSPGSNSWALVSGDERRAGIEWLARYGGNDAKCGDEGSFIYMGSRRAFDGGMKERRKREGERERDRVGAQVAARKWPRGHERKRSLLALPRSSLQLHQPLATRWERGGRSLSPSLSLSLSWSLAREFSFPEMFSLRNFLTRVANELIVYLDLDDVRQGSFTTYRCRYLRCLGRRTCS